MNKPKDGLYHYVTGLPTVKIPQRIDLEYGKHAQEQTISDRYGMIVPPEYVDTSKDKLIELEIRRGVAVKLVLRIPYTKLYDLVLVFGPYDGFVRTLWLNEVNDGHKTLDRSKYVPINATR